MKGFAASTARGKEINNHKFVAGIYEGVNKVLGTSHFFHVRLKTFLPPFWSFPDSNAHLFYANVARDEKSWIYYIL